MVTDYRGYHNRMPRSRIPSGPDVRLEKDGQFGKTRVNLSTFVLVGGTRRRESTEKLEWMGVGPIGEVSYATKDVGHKRQCTFLS